MNLKAPSIRFIAILVQTLAFFHSAHGQSIDTSWKKFRDSDKCNEKLIYRVKASLAMMSVVDYFNQGFHYATGADGKDSLSAGARDYMLIRNNIYIPSAGVVSNTKPTSSHIARPLTKIPEEITNKVFQLLYLGEFNQLRLEVAELKRSHYLKSYANVMNSHVDYDFLWLFYISAANERYKSDQANGTKAMRLDKVTVEMMGGIEKNRKVEEGEVFYVDQSLAPYFKERYNQLAVGYALLGVDWPGYLAELRDLNEQVRRFVTRHDAKSPQIRQFVANLLAFYVGKKSLQEAYAAETQATASDRFFPNALYQKYREYIRANRTETVSGALVGPEFAGKTLTWHQICEVALQKLTNLAKQKGIPEIEVTQAMLEGKLNPDIIDLKLAYKGIFEQKASYSGNAEFDAFYKQQFPEIYNWNREFASGLVPPIVTNTYVASLWSNRFGPLKQNSMVQTFFNGKRQLVSAEDLALQYISWEIRNWRQFKSMYGFTFTEGVRFLQAVEEAKVSEQCGPNASNNSERPSTNSRRN